MPVCRFRGFLPRNLLLYLHFHLNMVRTWLAFAFLGDSKCECVVRALNLCSSKRHAWMMPETLVRTNYEQIAISRRTYHLAAVLCNASECSSHLKTQNMQIMKGLKVMSCRMYPTSIVPIHALACIAELLAIASCSCFAPAGRLPERQHDLRRPHVLALR